MENPCKIVCFGDSLTAGYTPVFARELNKKFPHVRSQVINEGMGGETSRDGLRRLASVASKKPDVALLCFGMNDLVKGVSVADFSKNISRMVTEFEKNRARVLLLTISPMRTALGTIGGIFAGRFAGKKTVRFYAGAPRAIARNIFCGNNRALNRYNQAIKDVARSKRVRVVDINKFWKHELKPWNRGLEDAVHPNKLGYSLYAKKLLQVVPRKSIIILWQYNGNPCECNYACPYCTYNPKTQSGHNFRGSIEGWHKAFKRAFGNQHLVFYLAHGEPTVGKKFYDVIDMIGSEPNWEVRMTTNLSQPLDRLVKTRVAREGRININGSFHPLMTSIESFLKQALFLRENGIEVSVVYVAWPPLLKRLERDFKLFNKHKFVFHVRRFQGVFRGKYYPFAYTESERRFIARYMDDAMIKYMLSFEPSFCKRTWSGVDFIIVDNEGNIGYCDDLRPDRHRLGNIFNNAFKLLAEPHLFPGLLVSDGTVDGVANFLELDYEQLDEGNNVLFFARQGGVYRKGNKVFYKNTKTDFDDPRVRAAYRFPPRNIRDWYYVFRCRERTLNSKLGQLINHLFFRPATALIARSRPALSIYRRLFSAE